ncbi:MAG: YdeI/OmpD-associated family protein [Caldilineales bacterium]|nr:YdeI/OmpD-associated family protein [Caldilineales bacterium]
MPTTQQDSYKGLPVIHFNSENEWERWLEAEHAQAQGLWLKLAKKDSGIPTVSYAEAVDVALCFGWIDGQKAAFDESYWLQRFTPRRSRSKWSQKNRARAEELMALGRMRAPGLRVIEAAKADGRWEAAYEPQSVAQIPADLQQALDENPNAKAFFEQLDSRNRYAILYRIQEAKRAETRARRIEQFVAMLSEGRTLY